MWAHISADLFIWLAYVSIPLVLLYFVRNVRPLPFKGLATLFALFILFCGFAHLIDALMFKYPLYRLAGVWKTATAVVSWTTVLALIHVAPRVRAVVANPGGHVLTGDTTLYQVAALPAPRLRVNDYTFAILAGVLALLVRAAIHQVVSTDHFFVLSLLAVVFVSWQYGFLPSVVTLLVSMVGMVTFFIAPFDPNEGRGFSNVLATAMFFFCGVCCAGLGEAQRRARKETRAALGVALERKADLEVEVARRRAVEEDLRRSETTLRAAVERFRSLTEAVPHIVWTADRTGQILFVNRRWEEYTGLALQSSTANGGMLDAVHPDDAERVRNEWLTTVTERPDRYSVQFRLRNSGGAYRWALSHAVPMRDANQAVVEWFGSITDIDDQIRYAERLERTVRKRTAALVSEVNERMSAEIEVRKQREFLDAILSNVADGIVACDASGTLTLFNPMAREFLGLGPDTVGPHAVAPDQWAPRYNLYRADGATLLPTEEIPLFRALRGELVRDAVMVIAPCDRPPRTLLASGQRLTDGDGNNLGAVVSMHDVTEEREANRQLDEAAAELRRTNAELARSNQELEQFAYVASHDLQEPLRKIQAFGNRLVTRFRADLPDVGKDYVDRMLTAAGRMRRLIDDLLMFSRVSTRARPFVPVDLGRLAGEVVSDLSERIDSSRAEVRIGPLDVIAADPFQIRQLLQNLIANAIKFHRPGVPPLVEIFGESITASFAPDEDPLPAFRLTVRDNGIGFDEKYLDRIFQVFQRLHGRSEYEGTGVGLAICRKIVDRHGGTITARSRVGEGTSFQVMLPDIRPRAPSDSTRISVESKKAEGINA
jgi:PAS domain S-box-containing protein